MSPALVPSHSAEEIVDLESQYLLQNYARHPLVLHRGDGPYMWDLNGKRYLDFIAGIGVNALGQNHPRIVAAIREQAARLIHSSNLFYNEYQGPLAKRLAATAHDHVPDGKTLSLARDADGNIRASIAAVSVRDAGGDEAAFAMTPDQYRGYLNGLATSFDHVAIDGVEKSLHTASRVAPDGGLMQ